MVATFHATHVTVWPARRSLGRRNSYDPFFKDLDHAFVVSEYIADVVRDLGYRGTIDVLPAGVRLSRFPYSPVDPPGDGTLRLLYVGRLTLRKGLDVLLHALPGIVEQFPRTQLEVVGSGAEGDQFAELASTLGVKQRVKFAGRSPEGGTGTISVAICSSCRVVSCPTAKCRARQSS